MKRILFGIIAGVAAGIFFAPKVGKDLRKELATSDAKVKTFGKALQELGKDAGSEVKSLLEKPEIQTMIDEGKKHIGDLLDTIESEARQLSKNAQSELSNLLDGAFGQTKKVKKKVIKKATAVKKSVTKKVAAAKKTVATAKKTIKKIPRK